MATLPRDLILGDEGNTTYGNFSQNYNYSENEFEKPSEEDSGQNAKIGTKVKSHSL